MLKHSRILPGAASLWLALTLCAASGAQANEATAPSQAAAATAADSSAAALADSGVAGEAAKAAPLQSLRDKMSYSTGVMTARTLKKNGVDFDVELLIEGLRDAIAGHPIRIPEKELKVVLQSMQADIQRKIASERSVTASINREKGLAYQTEFRKSAGVASLPGGLMYRVIKQGSGDKPASDLNTVVVRYRGTLIDGTQFDATPEGKTSTLRLTDVVTGLREALKRMPAGATWEVVVPPNLAYATRGSENIGPNETLVFNVELVALVD
jgi:FKBP-type peptidyl-prolyl cis-trans isomerase FklB